MSGSEGTWGISGRCCFKVFWKFILLIRPVEICGERAVIGEGSEGQGAAALSPLPARPCAAAGVDAESKRTELLCGNRG